MKISKEQYERIADSFPRQRGNVTQDNLQIINAILYVAENGCKWRSLPKEFGNWHSIYTRMSRWSKNGVLDRIFERLQRERLISIKIETISLDSTIVKVHPDGTGALKNRSAIHRKIQRRMDNQNSYGCRVSRMCADIQALPWQCRGCASGQKPFGAPWPCAAAMQPSHGHGL